METAMFTTLGGEDTAPPSRMVMVLTPVHDADGYPTFAGAEVRILPANDVLTGGQTEDQRQLTFRWSA